VEFGRHHVSYLKQEGFMGSKGVAEALACLAVVGALMIDAD